MLLYQKERNEMVSVGKRVSSWVGVCQSVLESCSGISKQRHMNSLDQTIIGVENIKKDKTPPVGLEPTTARLRAARSTD